MLLIFSILLTLALAYFITGIVMNKANNKGNSKAELEDICKNGFEIIEQEDTNTKYYGLNHYNKIQRQKAERH